MLAMVHLSILGCRDRNEDDESKTPLAERVRASLEEAAENEPPPASSGMMAPKNQNPARPSNEAVESVTTAPAIPAFQPLADAKAGEWAEYGTFERRHLRYEVVEAEAARINTRVRITEAGHPVGEPANREDRPDYDPVTDRDAYHQPEITCEQENVILAGRSWDSWCCESRWIDEDVHYVRRTWVNQEIPVFGILRMELRGDGQLEASLELTGFGTRVNSEN